MAQRDYVSRGRPPQKKKPNNKNNQRKQVKQSKQGAVASFPIVRLVIVVVLLIGFGVFLWSIKDNASTEVDTEIARPVAPTEEALPELPEEEWEYIRTLPGYEVEVDVEAQEKSDKRYLMQCASFRTRAQAEEMKAKIAFQGLEALIRHSSGSNGDWFRVILGPYESKRDAEKAKHSLRKVNIATCQIWYWNL
ncbi:MAG TPA: cell division protein FtsN [Alteromonas australica]|jgi:cell division protein FtsN|uniref:Cell division protein FtsN n=1 Tax=Alteromonas australica TaxID=589873 RepID=A0A358E2V4_9ALTE|nr:SPOR domain-containing protein [Alteromonas australica]MAF70410.1 cell division protein FtsN [Alteromonas sp.]MBU33292.1 cell division protein FtsN [Alteromonas sp.]HAU28277.1 cell division protein FtsN [Alteromonas australica]HAW76245.1 cell division protein FtsN [Alteromonas australica]HBU52740.1 cell division protein FtsN [Alteromonas australica]|tara:strand:+ start:1511 stop:2089 length:579 start_codon:yes stop_codon:yes gene_type:complete